MFLVNLHHVQPSLFMRMHNVSLDRGPPPPIVRHAERFGCRIHSSIYLRNVCSHSTQSDLTIRCRSAHDRLTYNTNVVQYFWPVILFVKLKKYFRSVSFYIVYSFSLFHSYLKLLPRCMQNQVLLVSLVLQL